MLGAWGGLMWYGPGMAASVAVGEGAITADIKAWAEPDATIAGDGIISLAKPTRLVNSPATITGAGSVVTALPKGRARPSATIKVNELTQDDVTGAVLEAQVEPGLTLKQALLDARKAAKLAAALSA